MRVVIAGGHGKIALILERLLADAGHEPVALIRNPDHAADVAAAGAEPVVLDLEAASVDEVVAVLEGADAAVFAAGAGPGSGAERKLTVDRDGAILLAEAAERAGASRFVVVSAMRAESYDEVSDEVFSVYLRAKSEADAAVRATGLDWTIVRPGSLTDEPASGLVAAGPTLPTGSISRADVAATVAEALTSGTASRTQFDLTAGEHPIAAALASLD
ncbi:NAD(P)H-binding protein [Agromyces salentinus]|uniref:SDR family oxidoreductase n=1 Tax=Agromyces salentinus TaxID=269421 RepID=A0ABN2MKG9_9MICO|nr:NAD(P)H-binding protein [Agromyces salentinus]